MTNKMILKKTQFWQQMMKYGRTQQRLLLAQKQQRIKLPRFIRQRLILLKRTTISQVLPMYPVADNRTIFQISFWTTGASEWCQAWGGRSCTRESARECSPQTAGPRQPVPRPVPFTATSPSCASASTLIRTFVSLAGWWWGARQCPQYSLWSLILKLRRLKRRAEWPSHSRT